VFARTYGCAAGKDFGGHEEVTRIENSAADTARMRNAIQVAVERAKSRVSSAFNLRTCSSIRISGRLGSKARSNPINRRGAKFYVNDATLQYLAQLLDKNGRPIVDFGIGPVRSDDAPSIWGHAVALCPSMQTMGSGKNSVFFGNPLYFVQCRVPSSMYIRRFWQNDKLVQFGLVGFESWLRVDSDLVTPNPSFVPYGYLSAALATQTR
jgi:predicted phage gp36 major capsid-like protein